MRSGKLKHRITIQERSKSQDATTGEEIKTWINFATPWASIEPLSVKDLIAAQGVKSEMTARMKIRYMDGITPDMRILYRDKLYNIHGVLPDAKSGREYLTIPVSEGLNDG